MYAPAVNNSAITSPICILVPDIILVSLELAGSGKDATDPAPGSLK
jgi:hypothetical protein